MSIFKANWTFLSHTFHSYFSKESLPISKNIVRFYGGQLQPTSEGCIAIFLMELCDGGSLFDLMTQTMPSKIPERKLIHTIAEAARGIQAMHQCNPPVTHRDIKIENILCNGGIYKLCDFGSCSTDVIDFSKISKNDYEMHEEVFKTSTTQMYRPPEMFEPSKQYLVDTKVDIWMLGCVLYTVAFFIHPFLEGSKTAIVDANYRFPPDSTYSTKFHDFIRHMITPDPKYRPTISEVLNICENYDRIPSIQLNQQAQQLKMKEDARIQEEKRIEASLGSKLKKFDGDIPMEELMRLQQRIKQQKDDDDDDFKESHQKRTVIPKKKAIATNVNSTSHQLEQIKQAYQNSSQTQYQQQQQQHAPQLHQTHSQGFQNQSHQKQTNLHHAQSDPFTAFGFASQPVSQNQNSIFSEFGFGTQQTQQTTKSNSSNSGMDIFEGFGVSSQNNNQNQSNNSIWDQFGNTQQSNSNTLKPPTSADPFSEFFSNGGTTKPAVNTVNLLDIDEDVPLPKKGGPINLLDLGF